MISRRTDQAAGEKYLSDSSNPVSLKKTKSKEQNKENFNRSNEYFSIFKKGTDSKGSQNPAWMIENNAKDRGQSDSLRRSLPVEAQTGQKSNNPMPNPFQDSSFL